MNRRSWLVLLACAAAGAFAPQAATAQAYPDKPVRSQPAARMPRPLRTQAGPASGVCSLHLLVCCQMVAEDAVRQACFEMLFHHATAQ